MPKNNRFVYLNDDISPDTPHGDIMEFRLTYEGKLPSTRGKTSGYDRRWEVKHKIRKHFHSQLKAYWKSNPVLTRIYDENGVYASGEGPAYKHMLERSDGFNWLPLVIEQNFLECRLDILYLRNGARGEVLSKSDIDNRVKTLIDALKVPSSSEIGDVEAGEGEDPFFCLLEDDRVISHLSIETDMLLSPSGDESADISTDSRVIVKVIVKPTLHAWMWDITTGAAFNKRES